MAAVAPRTLDIKEPQVLRHYPGDPNNFLWHHQILLHKIAPGHFVALTPDGDLERVDLHQVDHLTLERRADFPAPQAPFVCAFDEIARADLERYKRRAVQMASLFDESPIDEIDAYEWIVADISSPQFGEAVDEQQVDDGVVLGDSGLILSGNAEVFVRRIATSEKAAFLTQADASRSDVRLNGDHRDATGMRHLDFKVAVNKLTESPVPDWPLQGPRVTLELLKSIRSGPGDLATYHLSWAQSSGVNKFSMACHDHRIICNMLRAAIEVDQVNVCNLLCLEIMARRLVQIETAVGRSPSSPNFSGLELMLEDPIGAGGEAVTSTFDNWLAGKLKDKANIAKQTRLYREEFQSGRPSQASTTADVGDKGEGRGRGRGKGNPKGKAKAGAQSGGTGPLTTVHPGVLCQGALDHDFQSLIRIGAV